MADLSEHELACLHLGKMIFKLAQTNVIIRVGVESSVINGDQVKMNVTRLVNGKSASISETISALQLARLNDVDIIIDALAEKLRRVI
jgi:hypothetical protein